jgi:hypothetical protein
MKVVNDKLGNSPTPYPMTMKDDSVDVKAGNMRGFFNK